jgi:hypothetical protein
MRWAKNNVRVSRNLSIFDQAERAKQDGINLSYNNATTEWKRAAGESLIKVAKSLQEFTTDDIWAELATRGIHTGENRAMGAVIQSGRRAGVITLTGNYVASSRIEAHKGPKAVWISNIYEDDHNSDKPIDWEEVNKADRLADTLEDVELRRQLHE